MYDAFGWAPPATVDKFVTLRLSPVDDEGFFELTSSNELNTALLNLLLPTNTALGRMLDETDVDSELEHKLESMSQTVAETQYRLDPILDVKVIKSDDRYAKSGIDFDWVVNEIESKKIQFQIFFLDPLLVSNSQDDQHSVEVEILDERAF